MQTAVNETREAIAASAKSPKTARCPHCGGEVVLIKRRTMGGQFTFFWRHSDSTPRCPGRAKPPFR